MMYHSTQMLLIPSHVFRTLTCRGLSRLRSFRPRVSRPCPSRELLFEQADLPHQASWPMPLARRVILERKRSLHETSGRSQWCEKRPQTSETTLTPTQVDSPQIPRM